MQRHTVENLHLVTALKGQAFDDVEAIQFHTALGQVGQIPASRRRRTANPAAAVQSPASLQDAMDSAYRGRVGETLSPESLLDGVRSIGTQITILAELATQTQHSFFQFVNGSLGMVGGTGAVRPVHAVEALALGPLDPVDDGTGAHAEAARDATNGLVLTNGSYHVATPLGDPVCLLMKPSLGRRVFSYNRPPLFGMYWQRTVRNVVAVVPLCFLRRPDSS